MDTEVKLGENVTAKPKRKYNKKKESKKVVEESGGLHTAEVDSDGQDKVVKKKARKNNGAKQKEGHENGPMEQAVVVDAVVDDGLMTATKTQSSKGEQSNHEVVVPKKFKGWKGWAMVEEEEPMEKEDDVDVIVSQEANDDNTTRRSKRKR
ncbi:hypothetical protein DFH28DRAFT_932361 [Melampsora americana]|nr:hypothetical protein DFH28DRAFT_932361 [Melampsora americana]